MPVDLEKLYAELGTYADDVPMNHPGAARWRGGQRRRARLTATSLALLLVAGTVTGVVINQTRDGSGPPSQFGDLKRLGSVEMPFRAPEGVEFMFGGMASITGDRAYLSGVGTDAKLHAGAIDLTTGKAAWPTRTLGGADDGGTNISLPQAMVMIGESHESGPGYGDTGYVLDPASGKTRFEVRLDGQSAQAYESGFVLASAKDKTLKQVDWQTGAVRWTVQADLSADDWHLLPMGSPESTMASETTWTPPADDRLLALDGTGTLHIYAASTGAVLAKYPNLVPKDAQSSMRANGGKLYWVNAGAITMLDLDSGAAPRVVASATGNPTVTPCGSNRICYVMGQENQEVVVVEVTTGRELWRGAAAGARSTTSNGEQVLTDNGMLFDANGRKLSDSSGDATARWLSPDTILVLDRGGSEQVKMIRVNAADGTSKSLGTMRPPQGICAWTSRVAVCPDADGFTAWRIPTD
jgi:outer membrane protein assembly factor BamB